MTVNWVKLNDKKLNIVSWTNYVAMTTGIYVIINMKFKTKGSKYWYLNENREPC